MPYGRRYGIRRRGLSGRGRRVRMRSRLSSRMFPKRRRIVFRRGRRGLSRGGFRRRMPRGSVVMYKNPIAPILFTKLRATDIWAYAVELTNKNSFTNWYTNSAYDPIVGSSLTACSGYSVLAQLYKYCIVFACKMVVTFDIYTGHSALVYIMMEDHNFRHVTGVTKDFLEENPRDVVYRYQYSGGKNVRPVTLKMFRTIKSLEGKLELEPASYSSVVNGGPAVHTYGQIGTCYPSSGTSPGTTGTHAHVRVTYYCKFYDRVNVDA